MSNEGKGNATKKMSKEEKAKGKAPVSELDTTYNSDVDKKRKALKALQETGYLDGASLKGIAWASKSFAVEVCSVTAKLRLEVLNEIIADDHKQILESPSLLVKFLPSTDFSPETLKLKEEAEAGSTNAIEALKRQKEYKDWEKDLKFGQKVAGSIAMDLGVEAKKSMRKLSIEGKTPVFVRDETDLVLLKENGMKFTHYLVPAVPKSAPTLHKLLSAGHPVLLVLEEYTISLGDYLRAAGLEEDKDTSPPDLLVEGIRKRQKAHVAGRSESQRKEAHSSGQ